MDDIIKEIIKKKFVIGPMAGYTDRSFRQIMREAGASFCVTEMVSAAGLIYKNQETWEFARIAPTDKPTILQLFGPSADLLAPAARALCEAYHPAMIDINMGCPMQKIVREGAGSALLKTPEAITEIVRRVKVASKCPVSVKIRCGWDEEHVNISETVRAACLGGCDLITIHGRTRSMFYEGKVHRDWIRMGVEAAGEVPVLANGDIDSIASAESMLLETGAAGVMIARATVGNPFLVTELDQHFKHLPKPDTPTLNDRLSALLHHYDLLVEDYGERKATRIFRAIGPAYLKGLPGARAFRTAFVKCETKDEVEDLVERFEV